MSRLSFFVICGDLAAKMKIFAEIYKFICIFQKILLPLQPIWVQRRYTRAHAHEKNKTEKYGSRKTNIV